MKGFYQKYKIEKVNGTPIDSGAEYFVLRIDKDPHALKALYTYGVSVYSENEKLSSDLLAYIRRKKGLQPINKIK
jgi:hypothetical protein